MLCDLDLVEEEMEKSLLHISQATLYHEITSEILKYICSGFNRASGFNSSRFTQKFDYALIVESDRGLITKQSDANLRFRIILKRLCGILGKTIKMCWSKLRDQTKRGCQELNNKKDKHSSSLKSSRMGGKKKQDYTHEAEEEEDR